MKPNASQPAVPDEDDCCPECLGDDVRLTGDGELWCMDCEQFVE